jgi:DNA repair protein RecO (recombination protein O)
LSIFNCSGVVIRVSDLGENDKIVNIFTDKLGKISTVAKGAKKSRSKYLSITLPFCYGEYIVFRGKNMYNLSEGRIMESFQELLGSFEDLTYASYFCELIDISMVSEESNRELFKDFVTVLYLLRSGAMDREMLAMAFEIRLLKHTGYGLNFQNIEIDKAVFNSLKFLSEVTLDKIYRLSVNDKIKNEMHKLLKIYINNSYSRKPKSLDLLDSLKEES